MRLALVPRTAEFYELFAVAGRTAHEAARLTETRFREVPEPSVPHARVKELEREADDVVRNMFELLNTQYVTPFDREDISELARAVDDVVDFVEEASDLLDLYKIEAPMEQAQALTKVLVAACEQLAAGLEHLPEFKDLDKYWIEIHRLENEGDRISRDAVASLFSNGIDPMVVIRWKDMFAVLEEAIDATESAAQILEGIVIKNS